MTDEQKAKLKTIATDLKALHEQAETDVEATEEDSEACDTAIEIESYLDDALGAVLEVNEKLGIE